MCGQLTDDACSDVGSVDASDELIDHHIGQLVDRQLVDVRRIVDGTIVPGGRDDVQPSCFRHRNESERIAAEIFVGNVDHCSATGVLEAVELFDGKVHVIQNTVHTGAIEAEVDEDVLVRQRDADFLRRHRTENGVYAHVACLLVEPDSTQLRPATESLAHRYVPFDKGL